MLFLLASTMLLLAQTQAQAEPTARATMPPAKTAAAAMACQVEKSGPHSRLERCGSLSVLFLEGTPQERAFAKGSLLGQELSREVVDYFSLKLFDELPFQFGRSLFALAYNQVIRLLHRSAPRELAEEVDAMAEGMGVDPIYLRRAISLPDVASLLHVLGSHGPFRGLPASGCTSLAALEGGNFLYGRNLDFAGTGLFDRFPLLTVSIPPATSGELKHAAFGAHGLHFAGITGVNEAGIGFAVHQNYSTAGGITGVPMVFLGELVLRQARSLDEAEAILRAHRPAVLWTFVLTNLNTGEARAVESSPRHFFSRNMGAELAQTNHLMHPETQAVEFISVGTKTNSLLRMERAIEALAEGRGAAPSPERFAKLLAQQEDPAGSLSAYKDVLKALTVQTVLLESKQGRPFAYLSVDPAPTSSGRFAHFPLHPLWDGRFEATLVDLSQTPPARRAQQQEIAQAFSTYFDQHAPLAAAALLKNHNTLNAALFRAVAHYEAGLFAEAIALADQALADPRFTGEPAYIRQSVEWTKLASLIKLQRQEEAQRLAVALVERKPANGRLAELAAAVARGQNPQWHLLDLKFEFFTGDLSGRPH